MTAYGTQRGPHSHRRQPQDSIASIDGSSTLPPRAGQSEMVRKSHGARPARMDGRPWRRDRSGVLGCASSGFIQGPLEIARSGVEAPATRPQAGRSLDTPSSPRPVVRAGAAPRGRAHRTSWGLVLPSRGRGARSRRRRKLAAGTLSTSAPQCLSYFPSAIWPSATACYCQEGS